jgi:LmbE family N-acetylglucosaminyl deacetylase
VGSAIDPFNRALAVVMRPLLRHLGTDVTHIAAQRSCVVIAPHPDDETLGAGATIMRKVDAGTAVHVVVATDGSKSPVGDPAAVAAMRAGELAAATAVLGLGPADVTRLPFVDAELDRDDDTLVSAIAEVVAAQRPEEVLVTAETDPHDDHAALGAATRRALAGTGVRLLAYPVWQFERPARLVRQLRQSGRPELVRTAGYQERKARAVATYASQLADSDDAEEGVKPSYLRNFQGPVEMFFPIALDSAGGARGEDGAAGSGRPRGGG